MPKGTMRKLFFALALLIPVALESGCATKAAVASTPGALSPFDLTAYNSLIAVQASIESAKLQLTVTSPQTSKDLLNGIIAAYNIAMNSYKAYHAALAAGGTPDSTVLQAQITAVIGDVAAFVAQIKGTIAPVPPSLLPGDE